VGDNNIVAVAAVPSAVVARDNDRPVCRSMNRCAACRAEVNTIPPMDACVMMAPGIGLL